MFDRMALAGDGGFAVGVRLAVGTRRHEVSDRMALAGDGGFAVGARVGGLGGRPEPPK